MTSFFFFMLLLNFSLLNVGGAIFYFCYNFLKAFSGWIIATAMLITTCYEICI